MKHLIALLLLSVSVFGQGFRFDSQAVGPKGVLPNVTVTVCTGTATGIPCSPQANTYPDITVTPGTQCAANLQVVLTGTNSCQATSDALGNFGFWLAPGTYIYSITGANITGKNYTLTVPVGADSSGNLGNTTVSPSSTLTVNNIKQGAGTGFNMFDPNGADHFFISSSPPYTNTFLAGNGSGVIFLGSAAKTSVADTTGNIVTAGNITLQTTSQTLPAVISNDTAGGIAFSNNAGKALQFDNSTNVLFPGSTSGNTIVKAPAVASGTLTLPAATDTLVARTTSDTLTNKILGGTTPYNRLRANQGTALVNGDVTGITNFGTTASVSSVSGTDSAGIINIASAGTGQTANGTFTLTFHDGTWTTVPVCVANRVDGSGPNSAPVATTATATTLLFIFAGAALAGTTYGFNFICVGK